MFLHDAQPVEDLVCAVIGDRPHARREADLLVSGITGLGLDVLHGRRSLTDVRRTIDYHLERIF